MGRAGAKPASFFQWTEQLFQDLSCREIKFTTRQYLLQELKMGS